ncbi:MAG: beta-N-acetylhexosaminidase [Clostridia bacterium]|nr:beta-N-acetylhexosaminidase [Clostridia bacterium]
MSVAIIPKPVFMQLEEGSTGFTLHNGCTLKDETNTDGIFDDLCFFLGEKFGYVPLGGSEDGIFLFFSDKPIKSEGYEIDCRDGKINITAASAAGLFYALQTVKQLLNHNTSVPCLIIKDEPRFSQRGFMLDVSRHFFTVECVKLFIDAMAIHKLNRLHLHLTDDQGWRFYSESFPLLTLIGSERPFTALDRIPHRGFFSTDDIKEIVKYAHSKYIMVIPEIDIPGHCAAALTAMPSLSCAEKAAEVSTSFGVKSYCLCMGKDETYGFARRLTEELIQLFPDGEIHLGFNDIPFDEISRCPVCRRRMEENGLSDARQLARHFFDEITSGYDDIKFTVWKNGRQENRTGFIDSSAPYNIGADYSENSLKNCYSYSPNQKADGAEALLFSEYISTFEKAGYLMFPRLAAVSENAWTKEENKDYSAFLNALPGYYSLLRLYGLPYADKKQANPAFFKKTGLKIYSDIIRKLSESNK